MSSNDFDLAVIGSGSAGTAAALDAAAAGLAVVQFEAHEIGGTCVNRGSAAKKLLVAASRRGESIRTAAPFGWRVEAPTLDWPALRDAVRERLDVLSRRRAERLERAGVTLVREQVRLAGNGKIVAFEGHGEWSATDIVLATGSRPLVPDLPGAELAILSDDLFVPETLPGRLALVGGGYIAVELANLLQRLGVEVSVFESSEHLLDGFDPEVVARAEAAMRDAGIEVVTGCRVEGIEADGAGLRRLRIDGAEDRAGFDAVALVMGRSPNVERMGLEEAGVRIGDDGLVEVDERGRTSAERVHAVGDIAASPALAPVAIESGRAAVASILGHGFERTPGDHVPTGVWSTPECGAVGLTEAAAIEAGVDHEVRRTRFVPLDDELDDGAPESFVKLVVEPRGGRLLGFHAFDAHATELAQLAAMAVSAGLTERELERTMALHPTRGERIVGLGGPGSAVADDSD